jgi:hypothetical protein
VLLRFSAPAERVILITGLFCGIWAARFSAWAASGGGGLSSALRGSRRGHLGAFDWRCAYHALQAGELAVLPGTGHLITPAAVQTIINFFDRL